MNAALRFATEYGALSRILDRRAMRSVIGKSMVKARAILRSRKLTALDQAMSRNLTIHFDGTPMVLPLAQIDRLLAPRRDNPTFGNVRELYARNCYLRHLRLKKPVGAVLDLGANRGMFSLLALVALGAEIAVGVEPIMDYEEVFRLLLDANLCSAERAPRYRKFVASPAIERE